MTKNKENILPAVEGKKRKLQNKIGKRISYDQHKHSLQITMYWYEMNLNQQICRIFFRGEKLRTNFSRFKRYIPKKYSGDSTKLISCKRVHGIYNPVRKTRKIILNFFEKKGSIIDIRFIVLVQQIWTLIQTIDL